MARVKKRIILGVGLFFLLLFFGFLPLFLTKGEITAGSSSSKIGLVKINGVIVSSQPYVREIRKFAKDDDIRAILLRINSPGGAVAPSQEIYREILRAKKKKMIVVSMGNVAASGAYYISSAASYIFANAGTLTGSIGVIMEYMNVGELMSWMKIKPVVIKSGRFKDTGSPYRAPTPEEKKYLHTIIMDVYDQFINDVYNARKSAGLKKSLLRKIADGRVFSGRMALKYHLIDAIGDLYDAVDYIKKKLHLKGEPKLVRFRRKENIFSMLVDSLAHFSGFSGEAGLGENMLFTGYNIFYLWR